ncbi:uncharacterized protein LOC128279099 [Anopheles cruzii]|uniref:uncharacterized protein LOC128279099 n=1 Tax=Anopheles cruzii TaxID=68878 RepID=UPI0022EC1A87|nr:uncharacterized protein LOC128279099 [Anopheles cruzii]
MSCDEPKILYRIAVPSDCERIREALLTFHYPKESVHVAYVGQQIADPLRDDAQYALTFVQQGMAVIAIDVDHNRIVGVSIARCVRSGTAEQLLDEATTLGEGRRAEVLRLYAHLERNADVCGRFRVRRTYHVFVLAVDPRERRRAIGQKLMEFQLARGKSLEYRVVSADFTSDQAARIGARIDMRCVSALALGQYRNPSGEQPFVAPPDRIISTYARYVAGV